MQLTAICSVIRKTSTKKSGIFGNSEIPIPSHSKDIYHFDSHSRSRVNEWFIPISWKYHGTHWNFHEFLASNVWRWRRHRTSVALSAVTRTSLGRLIVCVPAGANATSSLHSTSSMTSSHHVHLDYPPTSKSSTSAFQVCWMGGSSTSTLGASGGTMGRRRSIFDF